MRKIRIEIGVEGFRSGIVIEPTSHVLELDLPEGIKSEEELQDYVVNQVFSNIRIESEFA